jgi:pyruvate dehydrogenase E1 component alpha subunit
MTIVARFEIDRSRFLGPDGKTLGELPEFAADRATLVDLYRWMLLARTFDAKATSLQRTGRLGTYASSLGQEAVSIGLAHAMLPEDVLLPSFREHGAQMLRGVTLKELFQYWGGDARGSNFAGPKQDFPVSIPVGSHAAHATGAGLAFKLRGEQRSLSRVHRRLRPRRWRKRRLQQASKVGRSMATMSSRCVRRRSKRCTKLDRAVAQR